MTVLGIPDQPQQPRRSHRVGVLAALLAALAVTVLLTICLLSAIGPMLAQVLGTAHTSAAARAATQDATDASASADWYTFKIWGGGFQVDVPGVIGSSHGYYIDDGNGQGVDLYHLDAPISSPLQQREAQIWVSILYSTKITDDNICPQGGVAVKIGHGGAQMPAWVRDEGRIVAVNLVLNGVAIQITLDSRDDAQPALTNYGDIWRHMLASFAPLPGQPKHTNHPCG